MSTTTETDVINDRRADDDRRTGSDRRKTDVPVALDRRNTDRRKVQRRRQIDPTTCERDYTNDEIEFMRALDDYKRRSGRMFPTCSEILEVLRELGYHKVIASEELASDETETVSDEATEVAELPDVEGAAATA